MDSHKQPEKINKAAQQLPPAHLIVGSDAATIEHAQKILQKTWCKNDKCNTCTPCLQIRTRQHHALLWLSPEKNYTRQDLEPIFKAISYTLEPGQQFFFVIEKAEFLTAVCANSLLKSMEEPPPGYHFILLTQRPKQLLPTIRSRCIITTLQNAPDIISHPFFELFSDTAPTDPSAFLRTLDKQRISERESIELLDALLHHWIKQFKDAVEKNDEKKQKVTTKMTNALKRTIAQPPMPGSSKLLWRELFLFMKA